jgi:hypothetical protein
MTVVRFGSLLVSGAVVGVTAALAGCGGSGGSGSAQPAPPPAATTAPPPAAPGAPTRKSAGPGALQAEATAAAAGDIPDNQVFLTFRDRPAGYSMKYPEGWAQQGSGKQVLFRDKNNIVRIVVAAGSAPSATAVRGEVTRLKGATLKSGPDPMTLAGKPGFKVVYTTESAPNPVTGKRIELVVDRYYVWRGGRRAIVDLGTPVGVDNVDAYRLMIESFRWS